MLQRPFRFIKTLYLNFTAANEMLLYTFELSNESNQNNRTSDALLFLRFINYQSVC